MTKGSVPKLGLFCLWNPAKKSSIHPISVQSSFKNFFLMCTLTNCTVSRNFVALFCLFRKLRLWLDSLCAHKFAQVSFLPKRKKAIGMCPGVPECTQRLVKSANQYLTSWTPESGFPPDTSLIFTTWSLEMRVVQLNNENHLSSSVTG